MNHLFYSFPLVIKKQRTKHFKDFFSYPEKIKHFAFSAFTNKAQTTLNNFNEFSSFNRYFFSLLIGTFCCNTTKRSMKSKKNI